MKAACTLDHLAFVVIVSVGLLAHRTEVALVSKLVAVCTASEGIVPQGRLVLEGRVEGRGGRGGERGGEGRRGEGRGGEGREGEGEGRGGAREGRRGEGRGVSKIVVGN